MKHIINNILLSALLFFVLLSFPSPAFTNTDSTHKNEGTKNFEQSQKHCHLGTIHIMSKNYEEAVDCFKMALKIYPDHLNAHFNLGVAYYGLKKYKKAVECYKHAIKINPNHSTAHFNLGLAYLGTGEKEKALKQYKILTKLNTGTAKILYKHIKQ